MKRRKGEITPPPGIAPPRPRSLAARLMDWPMKRQKLSNELPACWLSRVAASRGWIGGAGKTPRRRRPPLPRGLARPHRLVVLAMTIDPASRTREQGRCHAGRDHTPMAKPAGGARAPTRSTAKGHDRGRVVIRRPQSIAPLFDRRAAAKALLLCSLCKPPSGCRAGDQSDKRQPIWCRC